MRGTPLGVTSTSSSHSKVLLIRPPQQFNFGVWPRGPRLSIPTGLLGIASYLKNNGVDVQVYDAFVEGTDFDGNEFAKRNFYKRPPNRSSLTARWMNWTECGSLGTRQNVEKPEMVHFGASWEQIESDLRTLDPQIVGITNLFRENTQETLRTATLVRKVLPHCLIAVGGPNASAMGRQLMSDCPAIDLIGFGDGEHLMLNVTQCFDAERTIQDVPGIMFRESSGNLRVTEPSDTPNNLDEYGQLDYGLVRLERYFAYERAGIMARNVFEYSGSERAISMVTSRGCPYSCTFCSIHIHAGKKFRRHSVDFLVEQVERLVRRHNVRHIHFEDDNLTLDRRRFVQFLKEVIDRKLEFTWDTPNGVFADTLDEQLLKLMKKSGCVYLIIGVESGNQWVLDNIVRKQPLTLDRVRTTFELTKRVGLDLHAFYIVGFPRETMSQIRQTFSFAMRGLKDYGVIPHLSIARADPGTDLYKEAQSSNTLVSNVAISNAGGVRSDMFRRNLIQTDQFTPSSLEVENERFHRACIRVIMADRARFLFCRPTELIRSIFVIARDTLTQRMTLRQSLTKLFWCRLLYKQAIARRVPNSKVSEEETSPGNSPLRPHNYSAR